MLGRNAEPEVHSSRLMSIDVGLFGLGHPVHSLVQRTKSQPMNALPSGYRIVCAGRQTGVIIRISDMNCAKRVECGSRALRGDVCVSPRSSGHPVQVSRVRRVKKYGAARSPQSSQLSLPRRKLSSRAGEFSLDVGVTK